VFELAPRSSPNRLGRNASRFVPGASRSSWPGVGPALLEETIMKKQMKKLKLAKETVADLGRLDLRQATGGTFGCDTYNTCPSYTCYPGGGCTWSDEFTCYTCEGFCTSNLC
jgi:hypothetical protein